jgi:2-haloacid dehalogenase
MRLTNEKRDLLLGAYLALKTWPEVTPVLRILKAAGIRLSLLSNLTPAMLEGSINSAALDGVFDYVLSTDRVQTYKPDRAAYRLGVEAFGLLKEDILFVAFAGWDACGAKAFGYPTFWVNRLALPLEELGQIVDAEGKTLDDLKVFVFS